jgi:hypothetical protein
MMKLVEGDYVAASNNGEQIVILTLPAYADLKSTSTTIRRSEEL